MGLCPALCAIAFSLQGGSALVLDPPKAWPKASWQKPLGSREAQEFNRDMHLPLAQWLAENPGLGPSYFVKFGVPRGYGELMCWDGVEDVQNYSAFATQQFQTMTSFMMGYRGLNRGLQVTMNVEGVNFTTHLDANSYLADDPYCFALGWLKGQGVDGSLMANATAWRALADRECAKIQAEEQFPDELHTVAHHVAFNRVWPNLCECNVVDGLPPRGLPSMYHVYPGGIGKQPCRAVRRRDFREHVYRKCLLGFAATEVAYCYTRGCVLEGNTISHGSDCM